MTRPRRTVAGSLLAGLCLAALAGCGGASRTARFYALAPVEGAHVPASRPVGERGVITLGPVTVPEYLSRPQIVTRDEGNELRLAEFDRWGGSLEDEVTRTLQENLSALVPEGAGAVVRYSPGLGRLVPVRCRVGVELLRFEGAPGGTVVLKARYAVFGEGGRNLLAGGEATIREPVGGADYSALVGAMSRALAFLSRDIAAAIP